jgi:hypothetical protein
MTALPTLLLVVAIAAPHWMRLDRVSPGTASVIWSAALALRALLVVSVALQLAVAFPRTGQFAALTHWCLHTVLPVLPTELGLPGHRIGSLAVGVPILVLVASVASVGVAGLRAARAVAAALKTTSLASGPENSIIVSGADVVVAAAGIARPKLVVSAGALTALDDAELAAGLEHERGHIAHHHRILLVLAEIGRAIARPLPGTRRAVTELRFHLERDADRWAIAHRHDPCALASAICKAAERVPTTPAIASLGGGAVIRRIDELLEPHGTSPSRRAARTMRCVAGAMVVLAVASIVAIPAEAIGAAETVPVPDHSAHHCEQ